MPSRNVTPEKISINIRKGSSCRPAFVGSSPTLERQKLYRPFALRYNRLTTSAHSPKFLTKQLLKELSCNDLPARPTFTKSIIAPLHVHNQRNHSKYETFLNKCSRRQVGRKTNRIAEDVSHSDKWDFTLKSQREAQPKSQAVTNERFSNQFKGTERKTEIKQANLRYAYTQPRISKSKTNLENVLERSKNIWERRNTPLVKTAKIREVGKRISRTKTNVGLVSSRRKDMRIAAISPLKQIWNDNIFRNRFDKYQCYEKRRQLDKKSSGQKINLKKESGRSILIVRHPIEDFNKKELNLQNTMNIFRYIAEKQTQIVPSLQTEPAVSREGHIFRKSELEYANNMYKFKGIRKKSTGLSNSSAKKSKPVNPPDLLKFAGPRNRIPARTNRMTNYEKLFANKLTRRKMSRLKEIFNLREAEKLKMAKAQREREQKSKGKQQLSINHKMIKLEEIESKDSPNSRTDKKLESRNERPALNFSDSVTSKKDFENNLHKPVKPKDFLNYKQALKELKKESDKRETRADICPDDKELNKLPGLEKSTMKEPKEALQPQVYPKTSLLVKESHLPLEPCKRVPSADNDKPQLKDPKIEMKNETDRKEEKCSGRKHGLLNKFLGILKSFREK